MDGDVEIRPENAADHGQIRRVVADAFGSDVEGGLVERIGASPEFVSEMALVAEVVDEPLVVLGSPVM